MLHICEMGKLFKQPNTQRTFKDTEHNKGTNNLHKKTYWIICGLFLKFC